MEIKDIERDIFKDAKFGDKFKTRDGRMAVFFAFEMYNKNTAYFIIDPQQNRIENTHMTLLLTYDGYYNTKNGEDIVSRWEEQIDE